MDGGETEVGFRGVGVSRYSYEAGQVSALDETVNDYEILKDSEMNQTEFS